MDKKFEHELNNCQYNHKKVCYIPFRYYICHLFSNKLFFFAPHIAYVPVQCYSTDNSENPKIIDKKEYIYRKMQIADW